MHCFIAFDLSFVVQKSILDDYQIFFMICNLRRVVFFSKVSFYFTDIFQLASLFHCHVFLFNSSATQHCLGREITLNISSHLCVI